MKGGKKMPYVIVTSLYPNNKVAEVAKKRLEMRKKYPEDNKLGTRLVSGATKGTLQGVKTISVTEVKKGKLEDVLTRAGNMLAMFNNIQGFTSQMDIYMTTEEAYGVIGMSLPK
jgi:hypothetical protein